VSLCAYSTQNHDPAELKQAGYPEHATYVYRSSDGGYFELYSEQHPPPAEKHFGIANTDSYSIPAVALLTSNSDHKFNRFSREMTCDANLGTNFFLAPVSLPSGVSITNLEYFGHDSDMLRGNIAGLRRICQDNNLTLPTVEELTPTIGSTAVFDIGNFYATTNLLETVDNYNCNYHVIVQFACSLNDFNLRTFKVRLQWQRQISPPPPTATFLDVPTNHPFYAEVEAMVAAGITGGLGGGLYGPDKTLTRGQMAAFLSRALGL